ncbi:hypothetical protein HGRIS_003183 [Hohenbuehelia grisea]|uniref:Uncharacterized protein n=1 Tax=Hohenbuehelia grisea TaxID=104357 RepID=A0ABR3JNY7_9AGAR
MPTTASHTLSSNGEWTTNDLEAYGIRVEEQPAIDFFGSAFDSYTGHHQTRRSASQSELSLPTGPSTHAPVDASSNTILNLISLASQPPWGPRESAVPDLVVELLRTVGFESTAPTAVARTRKTMKLNVRGVSSYVTVDACVQDAASGTVLLLVDEEQRYSGEPCDPEARLVAKAVAACQYNAGVRHLNPAHSPHTSARPGSSSRQCEPFSIPAVIMFGTSPRFYRIDVTPSLDDAVRHGRAPETETVVYRHTPRVPGQWMDGLRALENRPMIFQCLEHLIPLVEQLATDLGVRSIPSSIDQVHAQLCSSGTSLTPKLAYAEVSASSKPEDPTTTCENVAKVHSNAPQHNAPVVEPLAGNDGPTYGMIKVREWRHKVQKALLGKRSPHVDNMAAIGELFTQIEGYTEMSISELQYSKLGKVMRHVAAIDDGVIPLEPQYRIRERARTLNERWLEVLQRATRDDAAPEDPPSAPLPAEAQEITYEPTFDNAYTYDDQQETVGIAPSQVLDERAASHKAILAPEYAEPELESTITHTYPPTPSTSVSRSHSERTLASQRARSIDTHGSVALVLHKISVWAQVLGDTFRLVEDARNREVARVRCLANMGVISATFADIEAFDVHGALYSNTNAIEDQAHIHAELSAFLSSVHRLATAEDGLIPQDKEYRLRKRAHAIVDRWDAVLNPDSETPTAAVGRTVAGVRDTGAGSAIRSAVGAPPSASTSVFSFTSSFGEDIEGDGDSDSFCMVDDDVPRAI